MCLVEQSYGILKESTYVLQGKQTRESLTELSFMTNDNKIIKVSETSLNLCDSVMDIFTETKIFACNWLNKKV